MRNLLASIFIALGFDSYAKKFYSKPNKNNSMNVSILKRPILKWILIIGIIVFIMDQCFKNNAKDNALSSDKDKIERNFSKFDGSFTKFKNFIKENLKDPSSFEHVETRYNDNKDGTVTVLMKYRAKNSFGAIVTEIAKCTLDVNSGNFSNVVTE